MSQNIRNFLIKNANLTVKKEATKLIQQTWLSDEFDPSPSTSSRQATSDESNFLQQFNEILNNGHELLNEDTNLVNEVGGSEFWLHPSEYSYLGFDRVSSRASNSNDGLLEDKMLGLRHKSPGKSNSIIRDEDFLADKGENSKLICSECGFFANNRKQLWRHGKREKHQIRDFVAQNLAHTPKIHKCQSCSFTTSSTFNLNRHVQRIHANERAHKCQHCNKSFKDVDTLRTHVKYKHSEERDFRCTNCDKPFASSSDLNRHIKLVHMNIREYKCSNCVKTFHTTANAKRHFNEVCNKKLQKLISES